ncbi:hypothetical protein [Gordonia sp. (in: high G+C Gram-positive bacteria)]|uniref:hypothetical protein n=1 Tax=Gordonia sp. (in: high G+C Gram-positive bacteria) TaxID=84139 RepID=UPI0039E64360
MRAQPPPRTLLGTAAAAAVLVAVSGCATGDPQSGPSSPVPSKAGTAREAVADCQKIPADGRIYRSALNLNFTRGEMLVAIPKDRKPRPAPAPPPPPPPPPVPPAPPVAPPPPAPQWQQPAPQWQQPAPQWQQPAPQWQQPAPQWQQPAPQWQAPPATYDPQRPADVVTVDNPPASTKPVDEECVSLKKWGPASPEVPPDGMLFTFRGAGGDGGQISFPVVSLTGGVLPPLGPDIPKVGPLVESFPADIGLSLGGKYYLASGCPLKIVAMSAMRGAGHFSCAGAVPMRENPLAPNDAARNPDEDKDEPPTPGAPGAPAPTPAPTGQPAPESTHLSGWFEVKP